MRGKGGINWDGEEDGVVIGEEQERRHKTKLGHTAAHVQLRATDGAGNVESNNFGTEKVVTGGDVGGDLHVDAATAVVHVLGSPVVASTLAGGTLILC